MMFFILVVAGCATPTAVTLVPHKTIPVYPIDPKPEKILLFNTYDVNAHKFRKNKQELYHKMIDSILFVCKDELIGRGSIESEIIPGFTNISAFAGDSVSLLLNKHQATHAIVITSFDVGFDQTEVSVEKSGGSKSREAFYDITSDIHFLFYSGQTLFKDSLMSKSAYFSFRSVISGVLAAGPNIVSNEKKAWEITRSNLIEYLNLFFPGVI